MNWIKSHPFAACFITGMVTMAVTVEVLTQLLGYEWNLLDWLAYVMMGVGIGMIIHSTRKKAVVVIVCGSLLLSGIQARSAPLLIAGVLVVIGAGGIIGCKAIKRCNKIAKARTNAWPEELEFQVAGSSQHSALFTWTETGYCVEERRLIHHEPTTFTLDIFVGATGATTTVSAQVGAQFSQSFFDFSQEVAEQGLFLPATPMDSACWATDGHPCEAEQSPLGWNPTTRVIRHGSGGILVRVEKSGDLRRWEPVIAMDVMTGSTLRLEDVGSEMCFYRVTTTQD